MGILGGTFNPPHNGHLAAARHAHDELGLERVLLVPVHTAPHKPSEADPGPGHRLAMTRLAAAGVAWLEVSEAEVQRGGPSYTVDTLRSIHASDPGGELTFIVGADMARTLPEWREPGEILKLARLAVAERDGTARRQIREALAPLHSGDRLAFLSMPPMHVSSSMVRERAAAGRSLRGLVPDAVADYIVDHELYGARREAVPTGVAT